MEVDKMVAEAFEAFGDFEGAVTELEDFGPVFEDMRPALKADLYRWHIDQLAAATARAEVAELRLKEVAQNFFEDACKAICQYCKYNIGYVGTDYLSHAVEPEDENSKKIYWCDAAPIRNIAAVKGLKGEG